MLSIKNGNKFMLFLILFQIVFSVALTITLIGINSVYPQYNNKISLLICVVQDLFIFLIPILIYSAAAKIKLRNVIPHNKLTLKNILFIIVLTILFQPIMSVFSSISSLFTSSSINDEIMNILDSLPFLISLAAMAIMPAIFEELTFRGILLSNYKETGIVKAAIISGIFFGLIHGDFYQMGYAAISGVFFSVIVIFTNSIYASILSHFFINGSQVVMYKLAVRFLTIEEKAAFSAAPSFQDNLNSIVFYLFLSVLAIPFFIAVFRKFFNYNKQNFIDYKFSISSGEFKIYNGELTENTRNGKIIDIYFVTAVLLMIAMTVFPFLLR